MKQRFLLILSLVIATVAIKVPIEYEEENNSDSPEKNSSHREHAPKYYSQEETDIDSYLIPPNPHQLEEVYPNTVVTPATYLLPPSVDQVSPNYYSPIESSGQTDWYPITQDTNKDQQIKLLPLKSEIVPIPIVNESKPYKILQYPRAGKAVNIRRPSIKLEPPVENASNDFIINVPSKELELPSEEINEQYKPYDYYSAEKIHSVQPSAVSHLAPPKLLYKHKNPTKLYPKKFHGAFKPVPIPIGQFAEDISLEVPKAKPAKYFQPLAGVEPGPILTPIDAKKIYQFQQADKERKVQQSVTSQEVTTEPLNTYADVPQTEQVVSETNFGYPGHNSYQSAPAPLKQKPPASQSNNHPAPDGRTEFRMHGMKGPHSYQFGYDTGKGKNRQFRYEERDNEGLVQGHYGYVDKFGKLRVVNYRAHPELGFQAEVPPEDNNDE